MKQVPFKSSLENRMRTIGTNLTDKTVKKVMSMTGSGGTKRRKMSQKSHLLSRIRKGRSSKKRVAKTVVKRKKKSVKSKKKSVKSKKKKPGLKRLKRRAKPIKKTRKKGGKTKRKQTGRGFTDIFD